MPTLQSEYLVCPSPLVFKLNFDGASRGNPGLAGFGGLCRDHDGRIMMVFLGSIGQDTNKSAELEGLIRGFEVLIRGAFFLAIIEGDSNTLVQMEKRMMNGKM